jgi:hypothetical protein
MRVPQSAHAGKRRCGFHKGMRTGLAPSRQKFCPLPPKQRSGTIGSVARARKNARQFDLSIASGRKYGRDRPCRARALSGAGASPARAWVPRASRHHPPQSLALTVFHGHDCRDGGFESFEAATARMVRDCPIVHRSGLTMET